MTAGSSRFLLKFLQCLLTSDAATDVMNISDMQRGEAGREAGPPYTGRWTAGAAGVGSRRQPTADLCCRRRKKQATCASAAVVGPQAAAAAPAKEQEGESFAGEGGRRGEEGEATAAREVSVTAIHNAGFS